jgi:RNA polymerase sigma-70 factor (ECF subfamily)
MYLISDGEFKSFYLEVFPAVRMFIFCKCNDTDLAEDIAQESMMRLWNNKEKIEKSKARSFVFTVSNNLFLDHIRHNKVKNGYASGITLHSDYNNPHYLMEMEEFRHKLEATINSIPEPSRHVFLLNRIEKMTYAQIAESLGLSVKAIEKRMQKAIEIMSALKLKT